MDISIKHGTPGKQKTACFIVAVYSGKHLGDVAGALDKTSRQALSRLVKRGDVTGKLEETLFVPNATGLTAERVMLVGAGKRAGISAAEYIKLVTKVASAVIEAGLKSALAAMKPGRSASRSPRSRVPRIALTSTRRCRNANRPASRASACTSTPPTRWPKQKPGSAIRSSRDCS